jgi:hypothetical protein
VLIHFKGMPGILDIRNCGVAAGLDLEPIAGKPGLRGMQVLESCIENGILVRITGDTIALAPPFVATPAEVQSFLETFGKGSKEGLLVLTSASPLGDLRVRADRLSQSLLELAQIGATKKVEFADLR